MPVVPSDDLKKEYIKSLLAITEEDKKSVLLYVVFDLAVVSLTLSEKVLQPSAKHAWLTVTGLVLLLISAFLFFNYYRKIHLSSFGLAKMLLELDTVKAEGMTKHVWQEHKSGYVIGYVVRLVGLVVLIVAYMRGGT
jgi:hypothetical protein